ncbi:MAG: hypothetical protein ACOYKO_04710 [Rhodoluna sp.]
MANMSDFSSQPLTREAMAAQAAAIAAKQAAEAGIPIPVEEVPIVAEPLPVAPPVVVPPIVVPIVKTAPAEEPVVAEPVVAEPAQSFTEVEKEILAVDLDADGNPQFKVSSALTGEFTASNLIVELPADITAGGALVTDTGELVVTGSIDVSALLTSTGEIDVIAFADGSDGDLDKDAQQNFIPGIPPIRISGVLAKTLGQPGMPGGAHRGINPYWYFAMLSGAALLIAGGIAISFYSGLFN